MSPTLSTAFKMQGPSFSISSACSTGAHCIGVGMEQIQLGKATYAACGAGENECYEFTAMFDCMGALSTKYNDDPTKLFTLHSFEPVPRKWLQRYFSFPCTACSLRLD